MGTKTFYRYTSHLILMLAAAFLSACGSSSGSGDSSGSGGSNSSSSSQQTQTDTIPDAFRLPGRVNAMPGEMIASEKVTISGIDASTPVSITGGEYAIDDGSFGTSDGTIENGEQVRVRVQAASEPGSSVSATLTVGGTFATFTALTADLSKRVEAEAQTLTGGSNVVADDEASGGEAALVGGSDYGLTISNTLDAQTLIVAYRSQADVDLTVTVGDEDAGQIHLGSSDGAYATAALVTSVESGDEVTLVNANTQTTNTETYIDYIEFAQSPFRLVSTFLDSGVNQTDGISVGPDGNMYVSGADSQNILHVTPDGDSSVFASGFTSANGSDFDSHGNLYVADYNGSAVRKVRPDGTMTTLASSLDGPAGIWVDQNDNVFVGLFGANLSGTGNSVLRISPDGAVSTYASGDGLRDVIGVVGNGEGRVFAGNWASGRIHEITGGTVELLASPGGTANQLCYNNGHIYAPNPRDALVRRISLDGTVEMFAGSNQRQAVDGPLSVANFGRPNACDFSEDGTEMYIMDTDANSMRKVDAGNP